MKKTSLMAILLIALSSLSSFTKNENLVITNNFQKKTELIASKFIELRLRKTSTVEFRNFIKSGLTLEAQKSFENKVNSYKKFSIAEAKKTTIFNKEEQSMLDLIIANVKNYSELNNLEKKITNSTTIKHKRLLLTDLSIIRAVNSYYGDMFSTQSVTSFSKLNAFPPGWWVEVIQFYNFVETGCNNGVCNIPGNCEGYEPDDSCSAWAWYMVEQTYGI